MEQEMLCLKKVRAFFIVRRARSLSRCIFRRVSQKETPRKNNRGALVGQQNETRNALLEESQGIFYSTEGEKFIPMYFS
jgi:hypothetical protein